MDSPVDDDANAAEPYSNPAHLIAKDLEDQAEHRETSMRVITKRRSSPQQKQSWNDELTYPLAAAFCVAYAVEFLYR